MPNAHLSFRRRNVYERKVLRMLRGGMADVIRDEAEGSGAAGPGDADCREAKFERLRMISHLHGLKITDLDAPFVTADELTILRWLAESQRLIGLRSCGIQDPGLRRSLKLCADMMKDAGVVLPNQTLNLYP